MVDVCVIASRNYLSADTTKRGIRFTLRTAHGALHFCEWGMRSHQARTRERLVSHICKEKKELMPHKIDVAQHQCFIHE